MSTACFPALQCKIDGDAMGARCRALRLPRQSTRLVNTAAAHHAQELYLPARPSQIRDRRATAIGASPSHATRLPSLALACSDSTHARMHARKQNSTRMTARQHDSTIAQHRAHARALTHSRTTARTHACPRPRAHNCTHGSTHNSTAAPRTTPDYPCALMPPLTTARWMSLTHILAVRCPLPSAWMSLTHSARSNRGTP